MARNEHLPIYTPTYDLCLWLEQVVRGFSRYYKYAIGSDRRPDGLARPAEPDISTLQRTGHFYFAET